MGNLQGCSLVNIKLFPKLPNLTRLDLSLNRISKGLEALKECPSLKFLTLSDNKFKDLESLEPLKDLKNLTHLDVGGNDFSLDAAELKGKIFSLLPQILYIDGEDKDGNEASDGEEEEEGDDGGPGLSALYDNTGLLDEDDEEDYEENGEAESEDDGSDEEGEDESGEPEVKKSKIDEGV